MPGRRMAGDLHYQIILIDGEAVVTGSFPFTEKALTGRTTRTWSSSTAGRWPSSSRKSSSAFSMPPASPAAGSLS